jgi:AmpD protein
MKRSRRRAPPARTWHLDRDGRVRGARQLASPNCDARPAGERIVLVVVHGISLPPGQFRGDGVERLFTNRLDAQAHPYFAQVAPLRVSAHLFVRRDGRVLQFVPCDRRAWHAGVSQWRGRERCNDFSVGIELEGTDERAYTRAQYGALAKLLKALRRRYPIEDVVGHSDVAPGRKTDPGPAFDWARVRGLPRPALDPGCRGRMSRACARDGPPGHPWLDPHPPRAPGR